MNRKMKSIKISNDSIKKELQSEKINLFQDKKDLQLFKMK
jgi:hypothetical protein